MRCGTVQGTYPEEEHSKSSTSALKITILTGNGTVTAPVGRHYLRHDIFSMIPTTLQLPYLYILILK